jgi:O-acetyl-ADP-ribose deacetylase (regulator of RNase III)
LVTTYNIWRERNEELLIFRRDDGIDLVEPQPATATASNPRRIPPEPIPLDLDYRAETLPEGGVPRSTSVIYGDLIKLALEGRFDVIVHGCNCRHAMGGGIARQIKNVFPEAEKADLATAYGAREKLGTLSTALVQRVGREFAVVNAYTQFEPGADANYDAIRSCFREIKKRFAGTRIGYPRIGAGIGGGDWSIISAIIDEELAGEDHTLVEYQPG